MSIKNDLLILPSHMFFDLDNTLWDDRHPLIKPAWDRLPYAINKVFGELPANFNWKNYKGSTDIDVVMKLVVGLRKNNISDSRTNFEIAEQVLSQMAIYYYENTEISIKPALFSEIEDVLSFLTEKGVKLGIISGNDGNEYVSEGRRIPAVGPYKLKQSGLDKYFRDPGLNFWGGDLGWRTRGDLVLAAQHKLKVDFQGKEGVVPPLVYVADSMGDYEGFIRAVENFRSSLTFEGNYDLRLILRHNGDMKLFHNDLIGKQAMYGSFTYSREREGGHGLLRDLVCMDDRYKPSDDRNHGYIFGIGTYDTTMYKSDPNMRVHIVPSLDSMFVNDGLVGRAWKNI